MNSNSKGFTLLEILFAVAIMGIGFLAMSQMQYLSLRQKTIAENGTFSSNMIQTLTDLELANAKRINLLNARVYLDSQALVPIINQNEYCDGSDDALCDVCPCNPLQVFISDEFDVLDEGPNTDFSCAPIDPNNFDASNVEYFTNSNDCENQDVINPEFVVMRRIISNFNDDSIPNQVELNITYVLKTLEQFKDEDNVEAMGGEGEIGGIFFGDSLIRQEFQVSAHVERDWTNFVSLAGGNWNEVIVSHIP